MDFPIIPTFSETKRFPAEAFRGAPEAENSGSEFERGEMGMNATRRLAGLAMGGTAFPIAGSGLRALAQAPAAGHDAGPAKYTTADVNSHQWRGAHAAPA